MRKVLESGAWARVRLVQVLLVLGVVVALAAEAQVAVRGETVYTMAGSPLADGVVLIGADGKISAVARASELDIPDGYRTLRAAVVTPGLIDVRATIGVSGWLNQNHDQDQVERSAAIQPELRAVDAYNPREPLVEWARSYGVTTIHTGHGPGALISGQTMIVKTRGNTVEEATLKPLAMIAATLSDRARGRNNKPPGTRAKMAAMLREALLKAQQYVDKRDKADEDKPTPRNLRDEALARVLAGEVPLLVTAHRSHDILTAIRIADEFGFRLVLDGAAEAYEVLDRIRESGAPVLVHATMFRAGGETENLTFENASLIRAAGIPMAIEGGYEAYVPKSRLVLFEAALAAAHGLSFEQALAAITIEAAKILEIDGRVGSIEAGKDGDLALYDGDPFEYMTHCTTVLIDGEIVSDRVR